MKCVFLIVPNLGIGGQEKIAVETARLLNAEIETYLVVFERVPQEYPSPVKVLDLELPPSKSLILKAVRVLRRNRALQRLKRQYHVDLAYSFGDVANLSNVLSTAGEKTILSVHGYGSVPKNRISRWLWHRLCKKADQTVCVSAQICRELRRVAALPDSKVSVLYNPYPVLEIRKKSVPEELLPQSSIVAVGRLESVKGYENLLKSFAVVQSQRPETRLFFVGDGSCKEALQELTCQLGLQTSVSFVGMQDNPYSWMAGAALFALSSYSEGFPNAMIEAMACGLPVIAVDCSSGPREILAPQLADPVNHPVQTPYGVLCPAFLQNEPLEQQKKKQRYFAEGILCLLNDPTYEKSCREKVQKRAEEFDENRYKKELLQLCEALGKGKGSGQ